MKDNKTSRIPILIVILFGGIAFFRIFLLILHLDSTEGTLITGIGQMVIEAVAAILIVMQLEQESMAEIKEASIKEAEFILQYNQAFIQDPNMTEVEHMLEKELMEGEKVKITDENRQSFINYLVYLEGLAPLILHGILKLEDIDDLMAYRFFLAVDNEALKMDQLYPYAEYYRGCFKLYKKWKSYRTELGRDCVWDKKEKSFPEENQPLDEWKEYNKYAE